jgi:hypothetical protein
MWRMSAVLPHVRRHAVAQEMAGSHLAGLRGHDVDAHRPREMVAAERFALGGQEHREVVRSDGNRWPCLRDVLLKPCRRALTNRHVAVFLALALATTTSPRSN